MQYVRAWQHLRAWLSTTICLLLSRIPKAKQSKINTHMHTQATPIHRQAGTILSLLVFNFISVGAPQLLFLLSFLYLFNRFMQVSVFVCFTCMCMYIFVGVYVSLFEPSATASENTNYRKSVCPHTHTNWRRYAKKKRHTKCVYYAWSIYSWIIEKSYISNLFFYSHITNIHLQTKSHITNIEHRVNGTYLFLCVCVYAHSKLARQLQRDPKRDVHKILILYK